MGLETIALLSLATTAASTVAQSVQARKQARAQKEGQAVQTALGSVDNAIARRRAAREARIQRARLVANSAATGTVGSSGFAGANSALQANLGQTFANQNTAETAARGISAANQRAADAESRSKQIQQFTKLANTTIGIADDAGIFS